MEKHSFKTLVERYYVSIPQQQRDYAYGRINELEKRENFLRNLKSYFEDGLSHELDFIFGSVNDGEVLLLDGQQRVTTLFLLHWYLALIWDENGYDYYDNFREFMISEKGESRFSYKTRYWAEDFCNMLVKLEFNSVDYRKKYSGFVNTVGVILSKEIRKEKWFLSQWDYDPTICSMLNMIDSIKSVFSPSDCKYYYRLLTDESAPKLVFNFLDLQQFNLSDELYIKMNSRGKSLTRFENIKSKLLLLYDETEKSANIVVRKKFNAKQSEIRTSGRNLGLRDYVSLMFDTRWTNIFWNEWLNKNNGNGKEPFVDEMMLCFISSIAIIEHIVFKLQGRLSLGRTDPLTAEIYNLMNEKDKYRGITIRYDVIESLFRENDYELLFKIIDYFNLFDGNGKLKAYLPESFSLFSDQEAFSCLAYDYQSSGMEYEKKAKTFAYLKYLINNPHPNQKHLDAWMHFVCNVCSNSYNLANYTDTFCSAIAGINYLYDEDIKTSLERKNVNTIKTLDVLQIEEELLKMQLSMNPKWEKAINDAEEKLSYFEGRIRFPLIDCSHVTAEDVFNDIKLAEFIGYVCRVSSVFSSNLGCECEEVLIKAMLSKGDYLMYYKSNWSLLKNADRDTSWRRFLKEKNNYSQDETISDKRDCFKAVIDDSLFDCANVASSLNKISKNYDTSIPMWRKQLIDNLEKICHGDVEAFGRDRFMRWNIDSTEYEHEQNSGNEDNYEIDLIFGSAITGYHAELFSLCLYYELKDYKFGDNGRIEYVRTKTSSIQPYFVLKNGDHDYIKVLYQDNNSFRFVDFVSGMEMEKDIKASDVKMKLEVYQREKESSI